MSIIYTIQHIANDDLINEGLKLVMTGNVGSVSDQVIQAAADGRAIVITGFSLTTNAGAPVQVQLGFGSTSTGAFFDGFISTTACVNRDFAAESRIYGGDSADLVITSTGVVYYTINMRLTGYKAGLQYVESDGADGHAAPRFPEADRRVGFE